MSLDSDDFDDYFGDLGRCVTAFYSYFGGRREDCRPGALF